MYLHVERIYQDDNFWKDCVSKAKHFFVTCLLPELLGNWNTRAHITSTVTRDDQSQSTISALTMSTNDQPQSTISALTM